MCGIAGYINIKKQGYITNICRNMVKSLHHRGPDDSGVWSDEEYNIALGHSRLSIIDLSSFGHQPMVSKSGRWVIVYNGEIYNFIELKSELQKLGINFKSTSDTEVILESISIWGVEQTVNKLIGMFAFSVWDNLNKKLYLVRDRIGIKPLYWYYSDGLFLFGSELKALIACDLWKPNINRDALCSYFRHNYIPAPASIYDNVYKLLPGHILTYQPGSQPNIKSYWSLKNTINNLTDEVILDEKKAIKDLDKLLTDAITRRMVADVPLGAFLSGGIDSSTVAAIMQENSSRPINTFTIGFYEDNYNEAKHAFSIAKHLGTHHTELYVTPEQAMSVIPKIPDMYDEPFSDSSQIPTFLVSEMTKNHVTVSLSGDGGDECFAGYSRYFLAKRISMLQSVVPMAIKQAIANSINYFSPAFLDKLSNMMPPRIKPPQLGHKLHKLADVLTDDKDAFYTRLISHWYEPEMIVINGVEQKGMIWDKNINSGIDNIIDRMRYLDMLTYLPDDILTKVDRASMAVSLEARVPLLDHRVVEYSWRLPLHMKIRNGKGKWILRQVLYKYLPRELIERPKMGFGIPIDTWLRGPLREWAEELLNEKKIREQGLLRYAPIKQKWKEHLTGRHNWQYLLWDVLMFQAWYERWVE